MPSSECQAPSAHIMGFHKRKHQKTQAKAQDHTIKHQRNTRKTQARTQDKTQEHTRETQENPMNSYGLQGPRCLGLPSTIFEALIFSRAGRKDPSQPRSGILAARCEPHSRAGRKDPSQPRGGILAARCEPQEKERGATTTRTVGRGEEDEERRPRRGGRGEEAKERKPRRGNQGINQSSII